jgi:hypothetical protein
MCLFEFHSPYDELFADNLNHCWFYPLVSGFKPLLNINIVVYA